MLRDDAVTMLLQKLGDRDDLTAVILSEFLISQEFRLEQNGSFQPWFMISERAQINTAIGEARVPLPATFINEVEDSQLQYLTASGKWQILDKVDEDVAENAQLGSGAPLYYTLLGDHLTIYPTPDAIYSLRMRFAAKQTSLATNIENNWLKYASDLIIADVGEKIAKTNLQNKGLANQFAEDKADALKRLYVMHESRVHTNRTYQMGRG